jgi:hypothetical protein
VRTAALMNGGDAGGPGHGPGLAEPSGAPRLVGALNLGLRFCVEVATFASLGYWGASVHAPMIVRAVLAVAAPAAAIAAWSRWLAPRAPRRLTGPAALTVELSIFAAATWALAASGLGPVGLVYGPLAVANALLVRRLGQYAPAAATLPWGDGAR